MSTVSIFGYYGMGNTGDEAILSAMVDGLKEKIPSIEIGVYSSRPALTEEVHSIPSYIPFKTSLISLFIGFLGKNRKNFYKSIKHFIRSDLIIIGGGGLFFDSKESNEWMYKYINLIRFSKLLNKKVALIGVSIGPIFLPDSHDVIGETFPKLDLISVRDELSKNLLLECGIEQKAINVVPDLVFSLHSPAKQHLAKILNNEENNLLNDKFFLIVPCCYSDKNEDWAKQYADICEQVTASKIKIAFLPMQLNGDYDDLKSIKKIYSLLSKEAKENSFIFERDFTPKEYQGIIASAYFVLAERLHGTIMAINAHTPFLSIAYMPKVSGVLKDFSLESQSISMDEFLSGSLAHSINNLVESTVKNQPALHELIEKKRSLSKENFSLIKEII